MQSIFNLTQQSSKTLRLSNKASFIYMQASTDLPWTACKSLLQKRYTKKITLNHHYFYISQSHFKLSFSNVRYAIAAISLHKLPNTNMHIVTSMSSQVHVQYQAKTQHFPILYRSCTSASFFSGSSFPSNLLSACLQPIPC